MVRAPDQPPPNITPESLPERCLLHPVGAAGWPPKIGTSRQELVSCEPGGTATSFFAPDALQAFGVFCLGQYE